MKSVYNFKTKTIMLTASLILSIVASELILNFITKPFFEPKVDIAEKNDNRYDDIYEYFNSQEQKKDIIAIGDSFTNGGNVSVESSYPHQLFLELEKKYSVYNLGICEDTSKGVLIRLKDFYSKRPKKDNIVILLVGAADYFFEEDEKFTTSYQNVLKYGGVPIEEFQGKLEKTNNFISNLKTFKMIKFVLREVFNQHDESLIKNESEIESCYQAQNKKVCLEAYLKKKILNADSLDNINKTQFEILKLIKLNKKYSKNVESSIVEDLLTISDIHPKALAILDLGYNIFAYSTKQSEISIQNNIIPRLEQNYFKEKAYIDKMAPNELEKFANIFSSFKKVSNNIDELSNRQFKNFTEIANLVQSNNGELILMTYPLQYEIVNQNVRKIAKERELKLVDLEMRFKEMMARGTPTEDLIGDWEHCTPLGYSVIAKELKPIIMTP
ncbi:MAG: hypothetical protein OHK0056_30800 [Bacteriovoracaceae bacterium]